MNCKYQICPKGLWYLVHYWSVSHWIWFVAEYHFRVTITMTSAPQTMSEDSAQQQLSNSNKSKPPEVELNLRPGVQMSPPRATARWEHQGSLCCLIFSISPDPPRASRVPATPPGARWSGAPPPGPGGRAWTTWRTALRGRSRWQIRLTTPTDLILGSRNTKWKEEKGWIRWVKEKSLLSNDDLPVVRNCGERNS